MMNDQLKLTVRGFVHIEDIDTGEILLDKDNAIHYENLSVAITKALSNRSDGHIFNMVFGNGGSVVSGTGTITYFPPNTTGMTAQLYNQTYSKIIDSQNPNADPNSSMAIRHLVNSVYSDLVIKCVLGYNEPANQDVFDNSSVTDSSFVFDEIGLKAWDQYSDSGALLTHIIFNPIQKSLNRRIGITYTLRIQMA